MYSATYTEIIRLYKQCDSKIALFHYRPPWYNGLSASISQVLIDFQNRGCEFELWKHLLFFVFFFFVSQSKAIDYFIDEQMEETWQMTAILNPVTPT